MGGYKNDAILLSGGPLTTVKPDLQAQPTVYPNPAMDFLRVSGFQEPSICIIRDLSGRELLKAKTNPNGIILTNHLDTGMYIIEIKINNTVYRQKFMKH